MTVSLFKVGPGVGDRLRFGPWRGEMLTAYIAPTLLDRQPISTEDVSRCLDAAAAQGYRRAVTAALGERDQAPFLEVGFEVAERLHLLIHPLDRIPEFQPTVPIRAPRRRDRAAALTVDNAAFDDFWRLDESGLRDALTATTAAHFRVARRAGHRRFRLDRSSATSCDGGAAGVIGYAICGRADGHGYVQRLAVDPACQGAGIGTSLLLDGLRWLRRWGAHDALVNTQHGNERSLRLYQRTGFVLQPEGLAVLHFDRSAGTA